jgi:hypothetical protein
MEVFMGKMFAGKNRMNAVAVSAAVRESDPGLRV